MNNRVLVTGGSGYIGSMLCSKLIQNGYSLNVLDNIDRKKSILNSAFPDISFQYFSGDIRNADLVEKSLEGVWAVIHLAGISDGRMGRKDPTLTMEVNYNSFSSLVSKAQKHGVKKFFFASTIGVYGDKYPKPLNEDLGISPAEPYSESKALCEKILLDFNSRFFTTSILRISMVYGLSLMTRFDFLVNQLTINAIEKGELSVLGGSQKRPQIHVRDVTDYFVNMLNINDSLISGQIFNAGSENPTLLEIIRTVKKYIPKTKLTFFPEKFGEKSFEVDFSKIECKLGFKPRYRIDDGVREISEKYSKAPQI